MSISDRIMSLHESVREVQALVAAESRRSSTRDDQLREVRRELEAHRRAVEPLTDRIERIEQLAAAGANGHGH